MVLKPENADRSHCLLPANGGEEESLPDQESEIDYCTQQGEISRSEYDDAWDF